MDLSKMNLFVTGGAGFIGSNFCNYIAKYVKKLVIIDKLDYICNEKNIDEIIKLKNVIFIKDDMLKHDFLETFNKHEINYVIHFAAQTHVDNSYLNFSKFIDDNIIATYNLFKSIYEYGKIVRTIHFSTDEIYGSSCDKLFNEDSNFNPTNPYASTKASCEMIVNTYKYTYKLPIIITRCNNVYGKYQYHEKVIPLFINKALDNEDLTIHGYGIYIRDFIHVTDVINALLIIINIGIDGEIYNIGTDNPIKVIDLAKTIIKKVGKGNITYVKDRAYNDFRYPLDTTKLNNLGWKPFISFNEGLDDVIEWIKDNKNYFNEIKGRTFDDKRGKLQFLPVPDKEIKQQLISTNKKDVVRGIHVSPYAKHVICIKGSMIDYVINLDNLTYKKYYLSSNNLNKIYVPANHGHAFISLEDDSVMFYQIEGIYNPKNEKNYNYLCPFLNLDIPFENNYIVSDQDINAPFLKKIDYILLGSTGFLGKEIEKILKNQNKSYITLNTRLENTNLLEKQFKFYKPKYVINAAGISGRPTTEWCENNKEETLNTNLTYQLTLAELCNKLNIHLTVLASGIIYKDDGKKHKEIDEPNNDESFYCKCRILLEKCLNIYNNVLILRINYPMSLDGNPKCFLTKLKTRLNNINDVKINATIIPDLFKYIPYIIEKNNVGILNFVNKYEIALSEILNINNVYVYKINKENTKKVGFLNTEKLENLIELNDVFQAIINNV